MDALNLDARRAARAEAKNKPHPVILGGEEFIFPVELPLETLELMAEGRFRSAFALMLDEDPEALPPGGELTAKFFKCRPSDEDLAEIMGLYGRSPESSGSLPSSTSNGSRSKPTSKRSTTSTSRKRATAPALSAPGGSGS